MKRCAPYDRNDLHLKKGDRVLEDTNDHRCGDVKIYAHQTFVNADGEKLPFKDKEFDDVICNQVFRRQPMTLAE